MAKRKVRGTAVIENRQTGDGRVMAPGSITWAPLPLPLRTAPEDNGRHMGAIQMGTIDTLTRVGDEIQYTGTVDDEIPEAAEMIRRMDAGTAPLGNRYGVSIDPDDWAVEVVLTEAAEQEDGVIMMIASGTGEIPAARTLAAAARPVTAAAGDPDPGDEGGENGMVLWSESSDEVIDRYTRLRIRGLTALDIGAFDETYLELDGDGQADPASEAPAVEAVAAGAVDGAPALMRGLFPDYPPADWFAPVTDEPDGSLNITADGEVFGYTAAWGTCHTGYADRCVTPPTEVDYVPFHTGQVEVEGGDFLPCGVFTWGIPHANLAWSLIQAQDHYGHSDAMFARVAVGANEFGIWHHGALRNNLTRDDLADLRALSMSGDWRWSEQHKQLRMIASLAVNYPGFPVARKGAMAAAGATVPTLDMLAPQVHIEGDRILAMTSAGVLRPAVAAAAGDCGCGSHTAALEVREDHRIDSIAATLAKIEQRTRHLVPDAAKYAAEKIRAI